MNSGLTPPFLRLKFWRTYYAVTCSVYFIVGSSWIFLTLVFDFCKYESAIKRKAGVVQSFCQKSGRNFCWFCMNFCIVVYLLNGLKHAGAFPRGFHAPPPHTHFGFFRIVSCLVSIVFDPFVWNSVNKIGPHPLLVGLILPTPERLVLLTHLYEIRYTSRVS